MSKRHKHQQTRKPYYAPTLGNYNRLIQELVAEILLARGKGYSNPRFGDMEDAIRALNLEGRLKRSAEFANYRDYANAIGVVCAVKRDLVEAEWQCFLECMEELEGSVDMLWGRGLDSEKAKALRTLYTKAADFLKPRSGYEYPLAEASKAYWEFEDAFAAATAEVEEIEAGRRQERERDQQKQAQQFEASRRAEISKVRDLALEALV